MEKAGLARLSRAGVLLGCCLVAACLLVGSTLLVSSPASAATARKRPCSAGLVALTFDDGPSRTQTPRLVDILTERNVPATFFMVGNRIQSAPGVGRLVARKGFVVANHTWSHPQLPSLSDAEVRDQLRDTGLAFRRARIPHSQLMRPPYGAITPRVGKVVRDMGLTSVLWTVDSEDWAGGSSEQIADRILAQLRPHRRNVVLQHDGVTNSPNSVGAVPIVIKKARQRGYCFTDIDAAGRMRRETGGPRLHRPGTPGQARSTGPTRSAGRVLIAVDRPTGPAVSFRFRNLSILPVPGTQAAAAAPAVTATPGIPGIGLGILTPLLTWR